MNSLYFFLDRNMVSHCNYPYCTRDGGDITPSKNSVGDRCKECQEYYCNYHSVCFKTGRCSDCLADRERDRLWKKESQCKEFNCDKSGEIICKRCNESFCGLHFINTLNGEYCFDCYNCFVDGCENDPSSSCDSCHILVCEDHSAHLIAVKDQKYCFTCCVEKKIKLIPSQ